METKIDIKQINKPAPLWFRRLRDASVNFLLPALGQLVASIGLPDAKVKVWLQVLTFMPAAFNFFGALMGEDVKKKARTYMWLLLLIVLAFGCKSAERVTAEKAAKEDYARQQENKLLQKAREKYPCDTVSVYYTDTVERVIPGDTSYRNDTTIITLPGKTITRTKEHVVVDHAREKELINSLASAQYAAQLNAEDAAKNEKQLTKVTVERDLLRKKVGVLIAWVIGLAALLLTGVVLKLKSIF